MLFHMAAIAALPFTMPESGGNPRVSPWVQDLEGTNPNARNQRQ
jgi:hypothetical protein